MWAQPNPPTCPNRELHSSVMPGGSTRLSGGLRSRLRRTRELALQCSVSRRARLRCASAPRYVFWAAHAHGKAFVLSDTLRGPAIRAGLTGPSSFRCIRPSAFTVRGGRRILGDSPLHVVERLPRIEWAAVTKYFSLRADSNGRETQGSTHDARAT